MGVPLRHSLSLRLAGIIAALSGLALAVLTEVNRRNVEHLLLEQAETNAAVATAGMVDGLDAVLGSVERLARLAALQLEERPATAAELEAAARRLLAVGPQVYGCLAVREADGTRVGVGVQRTPGVAALTVRDLAAPGEAFWDRAWYKEVLERNRLVWSEPFFDRGGTDRNVVQVMVPVFRRGRTEADEPVAAGAVAVLIDLDWLRRLANVSEFSDTSFAIIFSRTGRLIIHPKQNYVIAETMTTLSEKDGTPEWAGIQEAVLSRRQGAQRFTDQRAGQRVHVNFRPSRTAGWGVVMGFDDAEFQRPLQAYRWMTIAFLGSALLALAVIAFVVTRLALRPLAGLAVAADEIGRKNLDCEIPAPPRPDEVGSLAASFRGMRDALKAQHLERRWSSQALEHQLRYNQLIIDSIHELVFVVTKTGHLSRVNPAVLTATGFKANDIIRLPLQKLVRPSAPVDGDEDPIRRALKEGIEVVDIAGVVSRFDATDIPVRFSIVPLREKVQVVGGVITARPLSPVSPAQRS